MCGTLCAHAHIPSWCVQLQWGNNQWLQQASQRLSKAAALPVGQGHYPEAPHTVFG